MFSLLYLCNRQTYLTKMSRVRFHGIEAIEKRANLKWSGPGWEGYDNNKTVQENIDILYPGKEFDLVIGYEPVGVKNFQDIKFTKCVRYNEMYDRKKTMNEIIQTQPNLVICHHHNDYTEYQKVFKGFSLFPMRFINIPHSAEKTIFRDYELPKKYDLLLGGAKNIRTCVGQHYPLRDRMVNIVSQLSNRYKCHVYRHPGYIHADAHTNKYLTDFAKVVNSAKICITCSGQPKSRFGKYIEIPMCASAIAADIPNEHQEEFKKFVIEINMDMSDDEIIKKLSYYIDNDDARQQLIMRGLEYCQDYTQEKYAQRFIECLQEIL